jgi:TonB-dependent receptor
VQTNRKVKKLINILCLLTALISLQVVSNDAYSQNSSKGKIVGKVFDKNTNETLIGLPVVIEGTTTGGQTNVEGRYEINNLVPGKYTIIFKYVSYTTKSVSDIEVKAGEATTLNVAMEEAATTMQEVVITSSYKKESIGALYSIQKNNIAISDGISSDIIKRSPDKSTGEVLRRVSGASIQDNKFVVIRGLSDRYNYALINGSPLPSTEPDRRAFSFDIFPANLLDNMTITKAATPELPGDFAGGVIELKTKDFPEETFFNISAGTSYNSISTFKPYYRNTTRGKTDWLGIDDGTRDLPGAFPKDKQSVTGLKKQAAAAQLIKNDWGNEKVNSTPLGQSLQVSYGTKGKVLGNTAGAIVALTYNNSQRYNLIERQNFEQVGTNRLFYYRDENYKNSVLWGALANFAYQVGDNSKISFKNIYNVTADNNTILRTGSNYESGTDTELVRAYIYEFVSKTMYSSQLNFEHTFPASKIKLNINGGYSAIERNEPNMRTLSYSRSSAATDGTPYLAEIGTIPDKNSRKFYSKLNEDGYSANGNVTVPFKISGTNHSIKLGGGVQTRKREYDARFLAYKRFGIMSDSILSLGPDQLLEASNIMDTTKTPLKGFVIEDISNPTSQYDAESNLKYGFIMFDNKLLKKLRVVWGARIESNMVKLNVDTLSSLKVDTQNIDILPSVNFTYELTQKTNIRLAYSKTLSRPEFRELASFTFEDFVTNVFVQGNKDLKRGTIDNYDIRFETYPNAGEIFSVTGFYKTFKDPIEFVFEGGNNTKTYRNVKGATTYGVEFEIRKKLNIFNRFNALAWEQWDNFTVSANYSLIRSEVDLSGNLFVYDSLRPLQGQSPYVINAGLQYYEPNVGFGVSLLYNIIGKRIVEAGYSGYADVWEAPRSLLDLQITKTLYKKIEFKFNCSDILNQSRIFYQDIDKNNKYNEDKDTFITRTKYGTTYSFSLAYTF